MQQILASHYNLVNIKVLKSLSLSSPLHTAIKREL